MKGVDFVRRKPHLFFSEGQFCASDAAARLKKQALLLGAVDVNIYHDNDWVILTSDYNWLLNNSQFENPADPFEFIISDPKLGANSCYGEIVIAAFCDDIFVFGKKDEIVKLDSRKSLPAILDKYIGPNLSLFFRSIGSDSIETIIVLI